MIKKKLPVSACLCETSIEYAVEIFGKDYDSAVLSVRPNNHDMYSAINMMENCFAYINNVKILRDSNDEEWSIAFYDNEEFVGYVYSELV